MTSDIRALRKWSSLDKATQRLLLDNVFCGKCFATTVVDYDIGSDKGGIITKGMCKKCDGEVARFVEDEWFDD